MHQKIRPFFWFDGQAEEAMNFYVSVFKDSKVVHVSRFGDNVMVVIFELLGQQFMGLNGGPTHAGFTEAVSFMIDCEDQAEVDYYWNALTADGGQESNCGWLKDKFGLSWQVVPKQLGDLMSGPDPEKAGRVGQAMMKMSKIIVADLEAAYHG